MPNHNKKNNAAACVTNHPMRLAVFVLIALLAWRYFASPTTKPVTGGGVAAEMYHPSPTQTANRDGGQLVMYFADWCPHCTRAKPAMESLQQKYGPDRVRMEDCTDREAAKRFGVSSFPTYRYFPSRRNSDDYVAYNGPRDLASLETYLKTH